MRAGTQIEIQKVDANIAALKAKQYISRKEGSQERSAAHFQNAGQFDLPSGKHAKSKSQNKFSQPELTRFNNSVERIAETSQTVQTSTPGLGPKDKRPNYTMHAQGGHVQVKQNLQQKGVKQADVMLNSAYNIKQTTRKQQVKGT